MYDDAIKQGNVLIHDTFINPFAKPSLVGIPPPLASGANFINKQTTYEAITIAIIKTITKIKLFLK